MEDEGIADMFEWDENVAFEEDATYIGRIESTRKDAIQLEGLPKPYWQYKELFKDEKAEMLAPLTYLRPRDRSKGRSYTPMGPDLPHVRLPARRT